MIPCLYCAREVRFAPGRGWHHVHAGQLVATRTVAQGVTRDDHVATPSYS